jgi:hypothetical protein
VWGLRVDVVPCVLGHIVVHGLELVANILDGFEEDRLERLGLGERGVLIGGVGVNVLVWCGAVSRRMNFEKEKPCGWQRLLTRPHYGILHAYDGGPCGRYYRRCMAWDLSKKSARV